VSVSEVRTMSKQKSEEPTVDAQPAYELAPDLTPEQWAVIKERSRQWEENYNPTSSLFPDMDI